MGRKVLLIIDGASDRPVAELGDRTPFDAARTPHLDRLAQCGRVGLAETVPADFTAASDVANLSLLGFDPHGLYTGRGPLEAASLGVKLSPGDIAFRVNTVTLTADDRMLDYSAGHITTEEAAEIIAACRPLVEKLGGHIVAGVQYRHLMVRRDGFESRTFAPHDNIGKPLGELMPPGVLGEIVTESRKLLRDHPVNRKRRAAGKRTADALWPWGQGRAVTLPSLEERFHARGSLVSAVDLIRGIGVLAGFRILRVDGITGLNDTNYAGKAEAAIAALKLGDDVAVIHVEAPDEAGHAGDAHEKVDAIENIDREIVGRLVREIPDLAILAAPDHPTFLDTRLHGSEPVPYLLADLAHPVKGPAGFAERFASGPTVDAKTLFPELMSLTVDR